MATRLKSLNRQLVVASISAVSLIALAACSNPDTMSKDSEGQSDMKVTAPPALAKELPSEYRSLPRQSAPLTACGFEEIPKSEAGVIGIRGWAIIEAAAGVVPEGFVLQIQKDGATYYVTPKPDERPDLAAKFNNPALSRSGFSVNLTTQQIEPPFTGTMLIRFDQRLFTCEYKLQA